MERLGHSVEARLGANHRGAQAVAGTVAENVQAHGTGALNIDGCRIAAADGTSTERTPSQNAGAVVYAQDRYTRDMLRGGNGSEIGRWPANLIHNGSDEVLAVFPDAPGQLAKASSSDTQRAGQNVTASSCAARMGKRRATTGVAPPVFLHGQPRASRGSRQGQHAPNGEANGADAVSVSAGRRHRAG